MNFTDTPMCKTRQNCVQCRNNEDFRKHMEKQYGPWECPENIPIGASLEQMPDQSKQMEKRKQEAQKEMQTRQLEMQQAIDELEQIVPPEGLPKVDKIRSMLFPQTKTPMNCMHGGDVVGEVDENCCGGKTKKVKAFNCQKHTITTERKCIKCNDFAKKRKPEK